MAWSINNNKSVRGKLLGLSCLPAVKNFGDYKILEVLIINKNLDFIFRSFKIVVPFFKGLNYYQKLFIMDFVIYFRRYKFLGIKNDKVELFIKAFLGKNYP